MNIITNKHIFYFFVLLFISCQNEKLKFTNPYDSLELHRKIAKEEFLNDLKYEYSDRKVPAEKIAFYDSLFSIEYQLPDSIPNTDLRIKYILANKELPDYIKKAIIEKKEIFLMTVGEFYLTFSDKADKFIIMPTSSLEFIVQEKEKTIGYNKVYRGFGWIFKNGFLHDWGHIN